MVTFIKRYSGILVILFSGFFCSSMVIAKVQTTGATSQISNQQSILSININTATAEEFASKLKGIGLSKAKRIVDYREKYGPFVEIEQLKEVSGIGQSIIDKNATILTL